MLPSNLKLTKAIAALVVAAASGLVYFGVISVEQMTGMIGALGAVFAFVYGEETRQKKKDEKVQ